MNWRWRISLWLVLVPDPVVETHDLPDGVFPTSCSVVYLRLLVQHGGEWWKCPEAGAHSLRHLLAVQLHRAAQREDLDRYDGVSVRHWAVLWGGGHAERSAGGVLPLGGQRTGQPTATYQTPGRPRLRNPSRKESHFFTDSTSSPVHLVERNWEKLKL